MNMASVRRSRYYLPSALSALIVFACAAPCHASLGGRPTDFGAGAASGPRARSFAASPASTFSVNRTTLPSGTTVREYVAANGVVFAVSWDGPFMPDLRTLLGPHFATLTGESAKHPKAGHSQLHIERPDVVIESTGHMRAYSGRAWITSLLPAGFTAEEIE
jgi:hypothetical protein